MMRMYEVECRENDDYGICNANGWSSWYPFISVMLVNVTKFQEIVFILEKCTCEEAHFLITMHLCTWTPVELHTFRSMKLCTQALEFLKNSIVFSNLQKTQIFSCVLNFETLANFYSHFLRIKSAPLPLVPLLLNYFYVGGQQQESFAKNLS